MNRELATVTGRIRTDGFAMPFSAFSRADATSLLEDYNRTCKIANQYPMLGAVHTVFKPHMIWKWADEIAHCDTMLDVVQEVLGEDILIWSMDVFRRTPEAAVALDVAPKRSDEIAPTGLNWHQDSLYLGLEPLSEIVRVWLALTPATLENGTMRYLRGSQANGTLPHIHPDPAARFAHRGPCIDIEVPEKDIVPVQLGPGEFAIHDIRTAHDSGANKTGRARVSVTVTYISGRVRAPRRLSAMPARGCHNKGQAFEFEARPSSDLDPASVDAFLNALNARINHMRAEGVPDFAGL